jgi:methionine-rich copper-binding protein CopC
MFATMRKSDAWQVTVAMLLVILSWLAFAAVSVAQERPKKETTIAERVATLESEFGKLQKQWKEFVEATGKPGSSYPKKNAEDFEKWIKSVERRLDAAENDIKGLMKK